MEQVNIAPNVTISDPNIDLDIGGSDKSVTVQSIMTSEQVSDAKGRKNQPVQVYVKNPGLGKSSGYYGLETKVRNTATIATDDQGRALIISAVAGG